MIFGGIAAVVARCGIYCYRRSSIVCWSRPWMVNCAKTADRGTDRDAVWGGRFGLGPRNNVLFQIGTTWWILYTEC